MVEYLKLAGAMVVLLLLAPIWLGISVWLAFQDKRAIRKSKQKYCEFERYASDIKMGRRQYRARIGTEAAAPAPRIVVVRDRADLQVGMDKPALLP